MRRGGVLCAFLFALAGSGALASEPRVSLQNARPGIERATHLDLLLTRAKNLAPEVVDARNSFFGTGDPVARVEAGYNGLLNSFRVTARQLGYPADPNVVWTAVYQQHAAELSTPDFPVALSRPWTDRTPGGKAFLKAYFQPIDGVYQFPGADIAAGAGYLGERHGIWSHPHALASLPPDVQRMVLRRMAEGDTLVWRAMGMDGDRFAVNGGMSAMATNEIYASRVEHVAASWLTRARGSIGTFHAVPASHVMYASGYVHGPGDVFGVSEFHVSARGVRQTHGAPIALEPVRTPAGRGPRLFGLRLSGKEAGALGLGAVLEVGQQWYAYSDWRLTSSRRELALKDQMVRMYDARADLDEHLEKQVSDPSLPWWERVLASGGWLELRGAGP